MAPRITDNGRGLSLRATNYTYHDLDARSFRSSLSYVTGSHALKVGFLLMNGHMGNAFDSFGHVNFTTVNGVPTQVTYLGHPIKVDNRVRNLGIFAQDQWRVRGLTVNAGARFDYLHTWYGDQNVPPTTYVPVARVIPRGEGTKWTDLSPRLGVSYDLFGTGKTALKATVNRYVLRSSANSEYINPITNNNANARRWTDNGDYIVQGDPFDHAANGELGPSTDLNFGKPIITARYDPDWARAFGVRPYNWEFSAGLQHEVIPGMAINASYFRRIYGNFGVTDNVEVASSDFSPYCVTAPVDPRLPGGGGNQICGLYDLNLSKVGQSFSLLTGANKYGDQFDHWNGVDVTMSARLARMLLQGGLSTGKAMRDHCAIATKYPQVEATSASGASNNFDVLASGRSVSTQFCHVDYPFLSK